MSVAFSQSNGGAALGTAIFDETAAVLFRSMKVPGQTVSISPKRLDFSAVDQNKSVLNVLTITNGTNSKVVIESLSISASGFRITSSMNLPLAIPPQTQALLTVEFLPTHPGDYNGSVEVLYRTDSASSGGKSHKTGIALKGKGNQK
jgi:hypothetical protein